MPTKLEIFDFDGTLFDSPSDSPENKTKYEKLTGIPWMIDKEMSQKLTKKLGRFVPMRRGWWGKAETLQPPLVPDPAPPEWFNRPVVERFLQSKQDEDALTLILTGRYSGLKNAVLRIIKDGKLLKIQTKHAKGGEKYYEVEDTQANIHFLGEKGPLPRKDIPGETFPWKVWMIEQYLELYPEIKSVEFWEDREEHVTKFRELDGVLAEKVVVNHVTIGP